LLYGDAPLDVRLRDYITAIGLDWEVQPPLDAEELARIVLAQLIKANRWDDLQHWLVLLEKTNPVMFNDLISRVRLLKAVRKGLTGDLDAAEAQLIQMEGA
jgi:hypothetical protein